MSRYDNMVDNNEYKQLLPPAKRTRYILDIRPTIDDSELLTKQCIPRPFSASGFISHKAVLPAYFSVNGYDFKKDN